MKKSLLAMSAVIALVAGLGACSETTTTRTSTSTSETIAGPPSDPVVLQRKSTTVETHEEDN